MEDATLDAQDVTCVTGISGFTYKAALTTKKKSTAEKQLGT